MNKDIENICHGCGEKIILNPNDNADIDIANKQSGVNVNYLNCEKCCGGLKGGYATKYIESENTLNVAVVPTSRQPHLYM